MSKLLHVGLDVGSTTVKIVVLDENLNIIKEWRKVKVKGHIAEVIDYLNL